MDFLCFAIETTKITPIVLKVPKPVIKLSESYTDADWSSGIHEIKIRITECVRSSRSEY
ncbi:Uncharacterised protein [Klebsiella pneumoniae]|nr:Uncharacterised protein [Klebsiella pneumoniae]SWH46763.1 Uncharacterised protein [Klebsiella pneumoniae]